MSEEKRLVIEVKNKIATLKSKNFTLVGGNNDYDVVFEFDKDWDELEAKTAVFVFGKGKPIYKVFKGNICEGVAIYDSTMCLIGVFSGDIKTTTPACVDGILLSIGDVATDLPQSPEDDVYNQIMDTFNNSLKNIFDKSVPKMGIIDQERFNSYEEVGGYYFSEHNWKSFIGDPKDMNKYPGLNRAYVNMSRERGDYGMYSLSPYANPIYNAWYSKAEWAERFAKEHPNETFREPYDNEYPLLDSIVQRANTGHIYVPLYSTDSNHAVSLFYANKLRDEFITIIEDYNQKFIEMRDDVYAGTLGLTYELSADGKHYISTGLGDVPEGSDIEIAAYYEGLPVTEVAEGAFQNKTFTSVRIPTTITKFGRNAFGWIGKTNRVYIKDIAKWCKATFEASSTPVTHSYPKVYIKGRYSEHLEIPEGVTSISPRAFMQWAQFKSITLPQTLKTIQSMSFQYCEGLESITIPTSVTTVDASAFGFCPALKTVAFEGKPSKLMPTVFEKDDALTDIYVPWSEGEVANAPWGAVNATVHYNCYGTEGLAYTLSNDGTYAICTGIGTATGTKIVIGSQYKGVPVTEIKAKAFKSNSTITDVVIPNSVNSIGYSAFENCTNLTTVEIADSVTTIGSYAFYQCQNLTKIHIPKGLSIIEDRMCSECHNLTSVEIPDTVTTIEDYAFYSCDLRQIVVPKNVTSIGIWAFAFNNNLRTVTIKGNVTSIGGYAFVEQAFIYRPIYIYVPWSSGSVSGAPWGAADATIHYNSEV